MNPLNLIQFLIVSDNDLDVPKNVGCIFPFQYVNPYYHPLTARTCANLLIETDRMPNVEKFSIACDCVSGFRMNFQGYCIEEERCNLLEAFGPEILSENEIQPFKHKHRKHENSAENKINLNEAVRDKADQHDPKNIVALAQQNNHESDDNEEQDCDGKQKIRAVISL